MSIQRYEVRPDVDGNTYGHEEPTGEWVKYADVAPLLSKKEKTTKEAKQSLIDAAQGKGDSTLDETADALLERVAAFFGECVGGDTFCGFGIDEVRNEQGLLLSLRFVPCDLVSGEAVRRVGR